MSVHKINSRAQLDQLLKTQKDYKKSVSSVKCQQCGKGMHYRIKETWTRCSICGYSGYLLGLK